MAALELPEVGTRRLDLPPDPPAPTLGMDRGEISSYSQSGGYRRPDPYDVTDQIVPEGGNRLDGEPPDPEGSRPVRSYPSRGRDYFPERRDTGVLRDTRDPFDVREPPSPEPGAVPVRGYTRPLDQYDPAEGGTGPSAMSRLRRVQAYRQAEGQRSEPDAFPPDATPDPVTQPEQRGALADVPEFSRGFRRDTEDLTADYGHPYARRPASATAPAGAPAPSGGAPGPTPQTGGVGNVVAFGDSITGNLIRLGGVPGSQSGKNKKWDPGNTAVSGWTPDQVFWIARHTPESEIQGKDIWLSTGASNVTGRPLDHNDLSSIISQVKTFREKGAKTVTLLGVGPGADAATNGALARIAQENGAHFSGPLDPRNLHDDGIHPRDYHQLRDQILRSRPTLTPPAAAPVAPAAGTEGGQPALAPDAAPVKPNMKYQPNGHPYNWLVENQPKVAEMVKYAADYYGVDPYRLAAHGALTKFPTNQGNIMGVTQEMADRLDPIHQYDRNTMWGSIALAARAVHMGDEAYGRNTAASIAHYNPTRDNTKKTDDSYVAQVLQQPAGTEFDYGTAKHPPPGALPGGPAPLQPGTERLPGMRELPEGSGSSVPREGGRSQISIQRNDGGFPQSAQQTPEKILARRIMNAEGTGGSNPWLIYGGDSFTPGAEHPGAMAGRRGPDGPTHAAGPGQWQPDTWNGNKPDFQAKFGRPPVFSSMEDQEQMMWLNAAKIYPGGENKMRSDIEAGRLNTAALSDEWRGFRANDGSVASGGSGSGKVAWGTVHPVHSHDGEGGMTPRGVMGAASESIQTGNPIAWTNYLQKNAPGMGMSEAWEHARGMLIQMFVSRGDIAGARDSLELVNQLAYSGFNQNLMMAYRSLQRGDNHGAASFLDRAYRFAPDGYNAQFGTSGNNLYGRRIDEYSGQPVGGAMPIRLEDISGMMQMTTNPMTFHKMVQDEQKSKSEAEFKRAQTIHTLGLNQTSLDRTAMREAGALAVASTNQRGATERAKLSSDTSRANVTDQQANANQRAEMAAQRAQTNALIQERSRTMAAQIAAGGKPSGADEHQMQTSLEHMLANTQPDALEATPEVAADPAKLRAYTGSLARLIGAARRQSGYQLPLGTATDAAIGVMKGRYKLQPGVSSATGEAGYSVVDGKTEKPLNVYLPKLEGDMLNPAAVPTAGPAVGNPNPYAGAAPNLAGASGTPAAAAR